MVGVDALPVVVAHLNVTIHPRFLLDAYITRLHSRRPLLIHFPGHGVGLHHLLTMVLAGSVVGVDLFHLAYVVACGRSQWSRLFNGL